MKKQIKTRFAPSPTGYLHIGGARTALFNWLFAKKEKGFFYLRIEDTDVIRSTEISKKSIIDGLKWLSLDWDGDIISQKSRKERHLEIANLLLNNNLAYRCYSSKDEIQSFKNNFKNDNKNSFFISPWRNRNESIIKNKPFVVRLKIPQNGNIEIDDKAKGKISWSFQNIEDLIIVRSDGTPTYNLAVVVDDYDLNISHVIRGDDHLTNTVKQCSIYNSLDWEKPIFCHLPLIHSDKGKKLSKRDGNFGLNDFIKEGFEPNSVLNYLLRLGWSHSNKEFFSIDEAINLFNLDAIGKSPSRIDNKKMKNISKFHFQKKDDKILLNEINSYSKKNLKKILNDQNLDKLKKAIPFLKLNCSTYKEILEKSNFFLNNTPKLIEQNEKKILDTHNLKLVEKYTYSLTNSSWDIDSLSDNLRNFVIKENIKFVEIAQPLRIILTGVKNAPSIDFVMFILGKNETLKRLNNFNKNLFN